MTLWPHCCVIVESLSLVWHYDCLIYIGSINNSCVLYILRFIWNMSEIREKILCFQLFVLSLGPILLIRTFVLLDRREDLIISG
jgi:hypothetical protein